MAYEYKKSLPISHMILFIRNPCVLVVIVTKINLGNPERSEQDAAY
jgi:hypothetical protein